MAGDPILGAKLRQRRLELGLSQIEVATDTGISHSHLSNVENGRKPIGRLALARLAERLDLSLDFLAAAAGEDPRGAARARTVKEAIILSLVRSLSEDATDGLVKFLEAQIKNPN